MRVVLKAAVPKVSTGALTLGTVELNWAKASVPGHTYINTSANQTPVIFTSVFSHL